MLHLAYVAAVDLPVAGRVDLGSAVVAGEVSSPQSPAEKTSGAGRRETAREVGAALGGIGGWPKK